MFLWTNFLCEKQIENDETMNLTNQKIFQYL